MAGWIFPSGIVVTIFTLVVFRHVDPVATHIPSSAAERATLLTFTSVAAGLLLNALQTPLYRILEGTYLWPRCIRTAREGHHLERRNDLRTRAESAKGLRLSNLLERLARYPAADDQIAATSLGNAIRAFESYGYDRFHLDSQTLWGELVASVPRSINTELDRAQASVDFFVSLFYLLLVFGALALVAAFTQSHHEVLLFTAGGVGLLTAPLWYGLAVSNTAHWQTAVQALVNLGRVPLAHALGLRLPATLEEEREMWDQVNWLVGDPYTDAAAEGIKPFRQQPLERAEPEPSQDGMTPEPAQRGAPEPDEDLTLNGDSGDQGDDDTTPEA